MSKSRMPADLCVWRCARGLLQNRGRGVETSISQPREWHILSVGIGIVIEPLDRFLTQGRKPPVQFETVSLHAQIV
jgi:hypothetical protein